MKRNDLFEIIFKLSSDWTVQLWWRLCGDASDPRTGCDTAWLAYNDRIHRFDHDFPDDTWANCDQCGNICRQQDRRSAGIDCGDLWVHFAVLYYRNFDRMVLFKI